ncbi:hypothetical protein L1279_002804 [Planomicrobium sp. HSC-17F08]|nr:hypothetical protein G159_03325 [Planococcus glaciei CHR43]MCP2035790.1 hypothetical protein [Planomicrobium sp. HSC-17F08]
MFPMNRFLLMQGTVIFLFFALAGYNKRKI